LEQGYEALTKVETLPYSVRKAPLEDIGKDRVRLHWKRRLGHRRFVILKLSRDGKTALVSALGHEGNEDDIQMDIDLRQRLAVEPGDSVRIAVSAAGWTGQLRWYLSATDPTVRVPAHLAVLSVAVGVIAILPVYSWAESAVAWLLATAK
jgi:hypothetical protein